MFETRQTSGSRQIRFIRIGGLLVQLYQTEEKRQIRISAGRAIAFHRVDSEFDSVTRWHMPVEFIGSLLQLLRFSSQNQHSTLFASHIISFDLMHSFCNRQVPRNLWNEMNLSGCRDGAVVRAHSRLPPMWLGFDSQTRRHLWVEVVGSLFCTEMCFSGYSRVSPLLKNKQSIVNFSLRCLQLVLHC